jgi:hypothetical protein
MGKQTKQFKRELEKIKENKEGFVNSSNFSTTAKHTTD